MGEKERELLGMKVYSNTLRKEENEVEEWRA